MFCVRSVYFVVLDLSHEFDVTRNAIGKRMNSHVYSVELVGNPPHKRKKQISRRAHTQNTKIVKDAIWL